MTGFPPVFESPSLRVTPSSHDIPVGISIYSGDRLSIDFLYANESEHVSQYWPKDSLVNTYLTNHLRRVTGIEFNGEHRTCETIVQHTEYTYWLVLDYFNDRNVLRSNQFTRWRIVEWLLYKHLPLALGR